MKKRKLFENQEFYESFFIIKFNQTIVLNSNLENNYRKIFRGSSYGY